MKYRREIDGLRALAVLPVVLFHAGFHSFHGGFIGVDVFFVISGYLISSILLTDLEEGKFSIIKFYERRARRILPALFAVMAFSSLFACLWMLPDELKNYGQSLIATTLFSNNILLAVTSGYWALASEFKPLLHTWSLGVEEQYYIFYPLVLCICWFLLKRRIAIIIGSLAILSFGASLWYSLKRPDAAFYLLHTRAWEIFVGALAAIYHLHYKKMSLHVWKSQLLSGLGILLIVLSIFLLSPDPSKAQLYIIVPVIGALLVVLYASESNVAGKFLGSSVMVGIGLISYSFYLWHQPFLAFARIYSRDQPSRGLFGILILASLAAAYLSWRYIERPFRDRNRVSRRVVFQASLAGAAAFVGVGVYLSHTYGMLSRMYDPRIAPVSVMDKRIYNERVFQYERGRFSDVQRLHVLVIGNSFARDFVNMTTETFSTKNIEIVYRHDFRQCVYPYKSDLEESLYSQADVIVFASWNPNSKCIQSDDDFFRNIHKEYFYIGSKNFGYNLNWVGRLKPDDRINQFNRLPQDVLNTESQMRAEIPANHYISLLANVVKDGSIPITDGQGYLISTDRAHVTKFGAIFFGQKALPHSPYGELLIRSNAFEVPDRFGSQ